MAPTTARRHTAEVPPTRKPLPRDPQHAAIDVIGVGTAIADRGRDELAVQRVGLGLQQVQAPRGDR